MSTDSEMLAAEEVPRRISLTALIRRSGLLAVGAGAYMVVLPFVHPSDEVGMRSAAWVPVHLLYFAALAVVLLALVGILARQLQRAGRLGVAGFLVAFVGAGMMLVEGGSTYSPPTSAWGRRSGCGS